MKITKTYLKQLIKEEILALEIQPPSRDAGPDEPLLRSDGVPAGGYPDKGPMSFPKITLKSLRHGADPMGQGEATFSVSKHHDKDGEDIKIRMGSLENLEAMAGYLEDELFEYSLQENFDEILKIIGPQVVKYWITKGFVAPVHPQHPSKYNN